MNYNNNNKKWIIQLVDMDDRAALKKHHLRVFSPFFQCLEMKKKRDLYSQSRKKKQMFDEHPNQAHLFDLLMDFFLSSKIIMKIDYKLKC